MSDGVVEGSGRPRPLRRNRHDRHQVALDPKEGVATFVHACPFQCSTGSRFACRSFGSRPPTHLVPTSSRLRPAHSERSEVLGPHHPPPVSVPMLGQRISLATGPWSPTAHTSSVPIADTSGTSRTDRGGARHELPVLAVPVQRQRTVSVHVGSHRPQIVRSRPPDRLQGGRPRTDVRIGDTFQCRPFHRSTSACTTVPCTRYPTAMHRGA